MPIPKEDVMSGAVIFYPTAQESSIIESERAMRKTAKKMEEDSRKVEQKLAHLEKLEKRYEALLEQKEEQNNGNT